MTNLPALTKREFTATFYSPIAYVISTFYLLFSGLSFYILLRDQQDANATRSLLTFLGFIHTIFIPMVTMRLISEERKSGTLEMLVTAPVSDTEIAISKFLGATLFTALMMAPTAIYTWVLHRIGGRPDHGMVYASYVGLFLLSMAYIAIGLFLSSLTANQIVAAILTFVVLFTFYFLMGFLSGSVDTLPFHDKIDWGAVLSYVHFGVHLQSFGKGLVDTRDVVYFMSIVVLGVFLHGEIARVAEVEMSVPSTPASWGTQARVGVASAVGLQLVLIIGMIVAVNWISSRRYRRFDWTDDVTYTLGEKTKAILAKISEGEAKYQIVVFYLPDEYGAWEGALKRTQDLLEEYRTQSRERIAYEIVPVATVGGGGVAAAQKKYDISTQVSGNDVVFKKGKKERVVNLREFFGQAWEDAGPRSAPKLTSFNGEKIVTSTLQVLSQDKPILLAFTTGHQEAIADASEQGMQDPGEWGAFVNQYLGGREGYGVGTIAIQPGAGIPGEVSVLVIPGPKRDFNQGEITALMVYLTSGGRILVTLDSGPECGDQPLPNLYKFLGELGIEPQVDMVLDPDNAVQVGSSDSSGFHVKKEIGTFPMSSFDRKHPVTEKFDADKQVIVIAACSLLTKPESLPEGARLSELGHSGPNSWGERDYPKNQAMNAGRDEPGPLTLAAAVKGTLKGGNGKEMRVVVLGDSTGMANRVPDQLRSPDLALNSIRWLADQEYLITVEPKEPEDRSLTLTPAQDSYVFRVAVLFLPVLAMAFGMTMFMTRRSA